MQNLDTLLATQKALLNRHLALISDNQSDYNTVLDQMARHD